jgi:transaldolase
MNPLNKLSEFGQAIWLDDIHRDLITSGDLKRLIEEDGLKGMTSNPAIFNKAIADSEVYETDIRELRGEGKSAKEISEALAIKDVRMAADVFRSLYEETDGEHGYVSIEVNPYLARSTQRTLEEARRLWQGVDRPNIFVKVPATKEGLGAIEQLLGEGINVNVTLLFSLPRYGEVANAFNRGIERRTRSGASVERLRSVASFFLSRIDALLDPQFEDIMAKGGEQAAVAKGLRGEVAIASAKMAYQMYKTIVGGERWQKLAAKGAHPQRLLWASTSTKNPDYSDVKYVESLIGRETINTAPMETIEAYRDHGNPHPRLEDHLDHARGVLADLRKVDVDINEAAQRLENEGIGKFCKPFDALLETLEKEMATA